MDSLAVMLEVEARVLHCDGILDYGLADLVDLFHRGDGHLEIGTVGELDFDGKRGV